MNPFRTPGLRDEPNTPWMTNEMFEAQEETKRKIFESKEQTKRVRVTEANRDAAFWKHQWKVTAFTISFCVAAVTYYQLHKKADPCEETLAVVRVGYQPVACAGHVEVNTGAISGEVIVRCVCDK